MDVVVVAAVVVVVAVVVAVVVFAPLFPYMANVGHVAAPCDAVPHIHTQLPQMLL